MSAINSIIKFYERAKRKRGVKYGLPFLVLVIGGSFGLKEFTSLRYQYRKSKMITFEEAEKYGIQMKKTPPTMEEAYEEIKGNDPATFKNIRGPRPWENSKEMQDAQRTS